MSIPQARINQAKKLSGNRRRTLPSYVFVSIRQDYSIFDFSARGTLRGWSDSAVQPLAWFASGGRNS
jgi:hypothetical protein